MKIGKSILFLFALPLLLAAGCSREPSASKPGKHEHHPPHGGVPVVLGEEAFHVELVLDASTGQLQAYVFDGELENFIRSAVPSVEIDATVAGAPRTLILNAVANPATGETVGDTSLFQGQADWLKSAREWDGVFRSITIRGTTFTDVKFNYPKGNDTD